MSRFAAPNSSYLTKLTIKVILSQVFEEGIKGNFGKVENDLSFLNTLRVIIIIEKKISAPIGALEVCN